MRWRNTASRYGFIASSLHWIIVLGVIAQYLLAEAGEDSEDAASAVADPISLHASLGVTLLALAVIRVVWRFIDPAPGPPASAKPYESVLARTVHVLFYALLFAIPVSGWMLASLEGDSLRYFGLFDLPALAGAASEDTIEEVHEILFNFLVGLALLHVAAAFKHRLVDSRDFLKRMLPGSDAK